MAYRLYEENEPAFRAAFMEDELLGVKILYFLDRVFQSFAADLLRFVGEETPLQAAGSSLRGSQINTVVKTLNGLKFSVRPTIWLPPRLTQGNSRTGGSMGASQDHAGLGMGANGDTGGNRGGGAPQAEGTPRLKTINSLPQGWKMPAGKAFGDLFNPRTPEETRANLARWPLTAHDKSGPQKPICIRLMTMGKCIKSHCPHAHVRPATLEQATLDAVTTRLTDIYWRC
jgi:hypothetical protein